MRCLNCGNKIQNSDQFCTKCGAKLNQQEYKDNKPAQKPKRRMIIVVAAGIILLFGLIGALTNGRSTATSNFPSQENTNGDLGWVEPDSREPEWVINADLSEYDMIGEWSDGKLMVHKTEGSYDYVDGSFAYIDTDGNILGDWHSDQDWLYPTDFCNDRALVYLGNDLGNGLMLCDHGYNQKAYYAVIDEDGQERFHFVASLEYQPILNIIHNTDEKRLFVNRDVHEFEENGYLFYKTKRCIWDELDADDPSTWTKTNLLIPDDNEFIRKITFESYTGDIWDGQTLIVEYDLDCFGKEYVNGYLKYQDTYRANGTTFLDYLFFDLNGNIALDVMEHIDYPIHEISDVREDLTFSVEFSGVDGNSYIVDMDMNGNWLTEPEPVN